ncbi:Not1 N-terminal domain, CCR4-Not complex component protein [Besnoitia besnoiti]|uniref:Not1 N-terminal domain, CCR4-Not complex component protein n=1 Tax=Besnoitia besnoiti TaxID=94643 RepID=A0A2A9MQK1_BESBE|nr:Not1 N-terminal domain, CCR4-Not complex component protein [Besnoitia besnoiti]PFH38527.1 Not1 N-terminal domain, CCR4-Not complex component protein [Besnoitia besnoiti]
MAEKRKLQQEVEKTLKRVEEGLDAFNDVCEKIHGPLVSSSQKEKLENELKREIKKLQRFRDQIKTWQTSSDIKDKAPLDEARKKIEREMERFKVCERESKMKAFSKEGLAAKTKLDPQEEERNRHREWLNEFISALNTHVDAHEAEEELLHSNKKGKQRDQANTERRLSQLQLYVQRHRWHINNMELILRRLENDSLDLSVMDELKESLELYIETFSDPDFFFDETLYTALNLDAPEDNASEVVKDSEEENTNSEPCGDATPPSGAGSKEASGAGASPTSTSSNPPGGSQRTGRLAAGSPAAAGETGRSSSTQSGVSTANRGAASSTRASLGTGGAAAGPQKGEKAVGGGESGQKATQAAGGAEKGAGSEGAGASSAGAAAAALNGMATNAAGGAQKKGAAEKAGGESGATGGRKTSHETDRAGAASPAQVSAKPRSASPGAENDAWTGRRAAGSASTPPAADPALAGTSRWVTVAGAGASAGSAAPKGTAGAEPEESRKREELEKASGAAGKDKRAAGKAQAVGGGESAGAQTAGAAAAVTGGSTDPASGRGQQAKGAAGAEEERVGGEDGRERRAGETDQATSAKSAEEDAEGKSASGLGMPGLQGNSGSSLSGIAALVGCSQAHCPTRSDGEQTQGGSVCGRNAASALGWGANGVFGVGPGGPGVRSLPPLSPQIPWTCAPESFPDTPLAGYDTRQLFSRLDLDTLFFVFYYQQGTYQQYLAARELKRQSWRYHKKYLTWFQRHEEPRITADKYEQGTYVYFDYDSGWCSKIKQDFTFEYCWLEDELAV